MKEYELTVLIHPDLEVDIETPLTKLRTIIANAGGEILREESWGKKRMTYKIKGVDYAVYNYFEVNLPSDAPLKISNILNITDEVLRYLLVTVDVKARKALEEAKANESDDSKKEE